MLLDVIADFKVTRREILGREAIAGVTTFFMMAYIVVVNPAVLNAGAGMPFSAMLTATVILSFSMTLLMGLYADLPFGVAPVAAMVPIFATAPVLIIVGALMFCSVTQMELSRIEDSLPAFLTIVLIPLMSSITQGILWGFLAHAALSTITGRAREVSPLMWGLSGISALLLALEHGGWR
ncbi:MAG: hypothetical protein AAB425_05550 [Bdellovibrionota bacterium]